MEAPAPNRSAASIRIRSRNACRSGVSPPPCGYLIQTAYRDDHTPSAPNDITLPKSVTVVALIDILKEAALRSGMLKALAPVGAREAIGEAKLLERLLLIAYAYGTNSGISFAAGEHGHSEEELRYTALRYLAAASLKAAGM
ncbi:hypothetical protein TNCT6_77830 [Streptomyces sp. 6-11-2]|nr:hypothetical protein TNCT6_77830 [Streptomyces sp. 6-11-2]